MGTEREQWEECTEAKDSDGAKEKNKESKRA